MYQNYKNARDKAWETLVECGISQLPVNLAYIANYYNISVIKYSQSNNKTLTGDGFSTMTNGQLIIYYNDFVYPITRQRFTIVHELGHCLLGHVKENIKTFRYNSETDKYNDVKEIQANVFARDILMPATVLHSLSVNSAEDISKICNVSKQSAEIRYKRLVELNKRGMYNKHPLERCVHNQFKDYIEKECKLRNSSHSGRE
ncbi:MAG: ImmA/IrrE family metallo-endopeptidase [Clostridia bacterium]|nr:ImmA/IrrE family metallo-endopeptidase [Clostridia bacterium]